MNDHHDDPHAKPWTDDEMELAREMIESYRAAKAVGRIARVMLIGLAMLAAAIASWDAVAGKFRAWLTP